MCRKFCIKGKCGTEFERELASLATLSLRGKVCCTPYHDGDAEDNFQMNLYSFTALKFRDTLKSFISVVFDCQTYRKTKSGRVSSDKFEIYLAFVGFTFSGQRRIWLSQVVVCRGRQKVYQDL